MSGGVRVHGKPQGYTEHNKSMQLLYSLLDLYTSQRDRNATEKRFCGHFHTFGSL